MLWELVHVFFEHRGLLAGRERAVHDTGASSFLYPFLAEREDDLEAVVGDVRDSVLDEGARRSASCARRRSPGAPTNCVRGRGDAHAMLRRAAARCSPSATAARPPTRWTWSPISGRRPGLAAPARARPDGGPGDPHRARERHRPGRDLRAPGDRLRPPGRRRAGALDQRNSANIVAALAEARRRGWRRSRWSATTAGASRRSILPTTSCVTPSQHIPRIQEAQASAYHVLRELVG